MDEATEAIADMALAKITQLEEELDRLKECEEVASSMNAQLVEDNKRLRGLCRTAIGGLLDAGALDDVKEIEEALDKL